MKKHLRWAALLALISATPLVAQENPAALVVSLQGDVQVRQGGAAAPAAVGTRLSAGDEVIPAGGARAILITRTGAQQVVTSATTVSEPRGGGNPDMFARALATLAQAASTDRTAGGRQGMIRPIPGEPTLVAPRNGLTVTTGHPTFSWMPVEGATEYMIQIRKVDGGRPMRFEVTGTEWTLPEGEPGLETGELYAWTVAPKGGRPTREEQFKLIGAEDNEVLFNTMDEIRVIGLDPFGDGLFLTTVIFRDLELYYDAASALEEVESAGSMTAELYLLKGEILNELGQEEAARKAFDKADAMMR